MSALAVAKPGANFKNEQIGDPVRRNSHESYGIEDPHSWERGWRKPLSIEEERELLRVAKTWHKHQPKGKGRHNYALGFRGLELLEYMVGQLKREGGYLRNMAIRGYATALDTSVQTIVNAIKALVKAGFLLKARRKRSLDEKGPTGRRKSVQEKNIYQLQLPRRAKRFSDFWKGRRSARPESQAEAAARHRAELDTREIARAKIEGRPPRLQPEPPHIATLRKLGMLPDPSSDSLKK